MNKYVFIVLALIFTVTFSSCATSSTVQNSENQVAGYTLKNKKELMHQKVLNKKNKTVIAMP
ncbi:hypothetical protein [Ulvibacter litoralis]|uniref:Uncharacterized protein n=1 Tax=Ulvibacter litoralis TaxID=227084 RepID=A0A1G7J760_9FLAO|nr:hypothetical protein [Ulvibacter litoralis]GHC64198.1 hypothetical protein GCM10008083_31840 [Ulvibacter litoralis]SDF20708.1 hypothetical protein SAMN05421855_10913 [Ulvibacter litoralis]